MNIYIALIDDRHSDVGAYPFRTLEGAIEFARDRANEYARGYHVQEEQLADWLYYARYSSEGDRVWVVERELAS